MEKPEIEKAQSCPSGQEEDKTTPCCSRPGEPPGDALGQMDAPWVSGKISTPAGWVPKITTRLTFADTLGTWKARWGINRMRYRVKPGLYAVGNPSPDSPVFVSANYKMSFDRLRASLDGRDGWLMVLDTKGINVWCAAGKGTFGTNEILNRMQVVNLAGVASHRLLILPQLGATGVRAHVVKQMSGFTVIYGPVRAEDIPAFLDAGMKATDAMRRVRFNLADRVLLIPLEIVSGMKYALIAAVCLFFLSGIGKAGFSTERVVSIGIPSAVLFVVVTFAGAVFIPILLPWLPGRTFSSKGLFLGSVFVAALLIYSLPLPGMFVNWFNTFAWVAIIPAVVSFIAMNFTGATTFTSPSGVRREMRAALPVQITLAVIGLILWLTGLFV
ncbi:MAG: mercury methylation corrinoid protein HgcA [bacterium]